MNLREIEFFNKSKLERILYLYKRGFNTPQFIIKIDSIKRLAVFQKDNMKKRFSIRTQGKDPKQTNCPHFPNIILNKSILQKLSTTIRKKFELLVFEAIDPSEAEIKGNLMIDKVNKMVTIEYSEGPGTVRSLETDIIPSLIKRVETSFDHFLLMEVNKSNFMGHQPSEFLDFPFESFIIEFSAYKYPVGIKNSKYIFWEIRHG